MSLCTAVCSFGGGDSAVASVLQTMVCCVAFAVHALWQPFRERSANVAQAGLLSCLVVVALLNVPQAVIDTNAVKESKKMQQRVAQLQDVEVVLLLAPAVVVGVPLLALAWRRRRELGRWAVGGCVALARCPCALWAFVTGERASDTKALLDEPLLPSSAGSAVGSKLVSNSRGLRLTCRTASDNE
jgi:hypothetical protein